MTKKKFISDYTEKFGFYMLEGESDGNAVKKVLGEVYDKMKRPTWEEYNQFIDEELSQFPRDYVIKKAFLLACDMIRKKYLSDSNGGDSADTVSDDHICTQYQKDTFCKKCGLFVPGSFYDLSKEEQEAILAPSEEDILSFAKRHPCTNPSTKRCAKRATRDTGRSTRRN